MLNTYARFCLVSLILIDRPHRLNLERAYRSKQGLFCSELISCGMGISPGRKEEQLLHDYPRFSGVIKCPARKNIAFSEYQHDPVEMFKRRASALDGALLTAPFTCGWYLRDILVIYFVTKVGMRHVSVWIACTVTS